jgi:hypothetical protein
MVLKHRRSSKTLIKGYENKAIIPLPNKREQKPHTNKLTNKYTHNSPNLAQPIKPLKTPSS